MIHTVGPVYQPGDDRSALLASCHRESLRVADRLGARAIAFPAMSTGVYGYPLDEAAPVALGAVLAEPLTHIVSVRFVLFDRAAYDAFTRAFDRLRP